MWPVRAHHTENWEVQRFPPPQKRPGFPAFWRRFFQQFVNSVDSLEFPIDDSGNYDIESEISAKYLLLRDPILWAMHWLLHVTENREH